MEIFLNAEGHVPICQVLLGVLKHVTGQPCGPRVLAEETIFKPSYHLRHLILKSRMTVEVDKGHRRSPFVERVFAVPGITLQDEVIRGNSTLNWVSEEGYIAARTSGQPVKAITLVPVYDSMLRPESPREATQRNVRLDLVL